MKKKFIIKKNQEFENIINLKRNYRNQYFTVYIKNNDKEYNRYGISIPKKVGIAVLRNKIKRQVKDIIDKNNIISIVGKDIIIIIKKDINLIKYNEIKDSLLNLLGKIQKEE
jgi:ribonuclease P protein component